MAPKCIVVGGGFAGVFVVQQLKNSNIEVTIVDKQDYLDWAPSTARSLVEPTKVKEKNFVIPLEGICTHLGANFIHSAAKNIKPNAVELANGQVLDADFIVVAIGGHYDNGQIWKSLPEHDTIAKRVESFRLEYEKVVSVSSVAVVGAGPTGVEVAAEIKSKFPEKKVTLVGPKFLAVMSDSARRRIRTALDKIGVEFVEGRFEKGSGKITTDTGVAVEAELVYQCAGYIFTGSELLSDELKSCVTTRGQIKCRTTFQLEESDTIFACGDIIHVPEGAFRPIAGVPHAEGIAKIVAKNIQIMAAASADKQTPKLKTFNWPKEPVTTPAITVLNPNVAVGDLGLPACLNFLQDAVSRKLKASDYFIGIQGKSLGKGSTW